MEYITILHGNTQPISFEVEDMDGQPVDLTQGQYKLMLDNREIEFEVRGVNKNQVYFVLQGNMDLLCKTYSLTLYKNKGGLWQMRLPMKDCIKVVND